MRDRINGSYLELLSHPGEILAEVLESRGITQKVLAFSMGLSLKHVNLIINGKEPITCETAVKLEQVLGIEAEFWNNLESIYCSAKIKYEQSKNISVDEVNIISKTPYKQLVDYGFLYDVPTKEERVVQLRKFYNVTNLCSLENVASGTALFRKAKASYNIYAMLAWIKMCEIVTADINVPNYSADKLKASIPEIIKLLDKEDIVKSIELLTEIFSNCGIAFRVVYNLAGAPVQGMIRKINDKVGLCLTIRQKYADIFWFTLFHEIGHLIHDDLENVFVDFYSKDSDAKEVRADKFANQIIIPPEEYKKFIDANAFTKESVKHFARQIKRMPGMVVGRLHHDGLIPMSWLNDLRLKYVWANEIE